MKKNASAIFRTVFLFFCFSIVLAACDKNTDEKFVKDEKSLTAKDKQNKPAGIFKARHIGSFCAYTIVQIQDSAFYSYGMEWTNSIGQTYHNVFSVKNHCDFTKSNLKINESFNCKIVENAVTENCMVCLGFMETPPLQHNINVVR